MRDDKEKNPEKPLIGLLIANPVDRKLLVDFISQSGYSVSAPEFSRSAIEKLEGVSMVIIDEALLRQCGTPLLKLKELSGAIFLPVLVASKTNKINVSWFGQGFDDILRLPIGKAELIARLSNYLRLREQSHELVRRSDIMFRSLVEQSLVGVFLISEGKPIVYNNDAIAQIFGYHTDELIGKVEFVDLIHADDRQQVSASIHELMAAERNHVQYECRGLCKNGSLVYCEVFMRRVQHKKQLSIIGALVNINERKIAEAALQTSLQEKTLLIRELYHRTKNNMQVISAMMHLQSRSISDENIRFIFLELETKIRSMALVHEKLYESGDLSSLNLKTYFNDLISLVRQSYLTSDDHIQIHYQADNVPVLIDTAMPLGLVLNELLSNAVKHAFPGGNKGIIQVRLDKGPREGLVIEVSDNGVGFPKDFDVKRDSHLGLQTVVDLVRHQLDGEVAFESKNGLSCRIVIKKELYDRRV